MFPPPPPVRKERRASPDRDGSAEPAERSADRTWRARPRRNHTRPSWGFFLTILVRLALGRPPRGDDAYEGAIRLEVDKGMDDQQQLSASRFSYCDPALLVDAIIIRARQRERIKEIRSLRP